MAATYFRRGRGRSRNAAIAQAEGRFPATRAARELGVSPAAFRAGVARAGGRSGEWHHVGKFATAVDFHDAAALAEDWRFWLGAATAYRGPRRAEMLRRAAMERSGAKARDHIEDLRRRQRASSRKPRAARCAEIAALCPGAPAHIISRWAGDLADGEAIAREASRIAARESDEASRRRAADLMASAWQRENAALRQAEDQWALAWWEHGLAAAGFLPGLPAIAAAIRLLGQPNASARWAAAEMFGLAHDPRSIETVRINGGRPPASFLRALAAARAAGRGSLIESALRAHVRRKAKRLPLHGAWEAH